MKLGIQSVPLGGDSYLAATLRSARAVPADPPSRGRLRRLWSSLVGVGVLTAITTGPALAAPPKVSLGEVTSRVLRSDVDMGAVLREAVQEQLSSLNTASRTEKGPFILSASLVKMDVETTKVTCVVSATLRTARGGTMLAVVEGKAGLLTEAPLTPPLLRRAVEAAAHAAVLRVPEALR
jgi:hypothetical protein